jgi:hypothetical protein
VKLLRTIQLDPSDAFVFARAATPGEWAVSGAFAFMGQDIAAFQGKARTAFRAGFLGISSPSPAFNFVEVVGEVEADHVDLEAHGKGGHN